MAIDNDVVGRGSKRRWVILGVIYLCMLAFAMVLQSVPPVLSLIMADLSLSHAQGGLLMSFFALPGIIVAIPAGMLADRHSQKTIVLVSLSLMILGPALVASGSSLPVLALGRIISGAGAVTFLVVAPQLLVQWFTGREVGIAMGIFNTGMPLGTILSLNFLSLLAENLDWRASIWLSAGLSLVALVVFALLFAPAPRRSGQISPKSEGFFQGIRLAGVPIWLVGAAWGLFNAAVISLFTFTPDLFRAAGFSIATAGFLTSLVMWPALVLSPLVGYIIDKVDRKRTIIAVGGLALAALIVWVPAAIGWILALMLIIGMAQALVPTPIFALPPDVTTPERLGLGFGILSTCLNLGMVVGPAAVGLMKDVTGSYQAGYALMSGFSLLIALAMFILARQRG